MRSFKEQIRGSDDNQIEFGGKTLNTWGWINPQNFEKMMMAGPIPLGDRGIDGFMELRKWKAFDEDDFFDDVNIYAIKHGEDFDMRFVLLDMFRTNQNYWWIVDPHGERHGQEISLYKLAERMLGQHEVWQQYLQWHGQNLRDEKIEKFNDFGF